MILAKRGKARLVHSPGSMPFKSWLWRQAGRKKLGIAARVYM
jgi:hypothetical protein